MDRRKFLGSVPVAGAAALVGISTSDGSRLFGQPSSLAKPDVITPEQVSDLLPSLFRLHMAMEHNTAVYSSTRLAACRLAITLVQDASVAELFLNNPARILQEYGITSDSIDKNSAEFGIISVLANSEVRSAAKNNDPIAFINAMSTLVDSSTASSNVVPILDTVAIVNSYVHLDVVATLSVVAVAVAIAAVVVLVVAAGVEPVQDSASVTVAGAIGGSKFAQDVASMQAQVAIDKVLAGVQSGDITLPEGVSQDEVLSALSTTLQRHQIVAN